MSSEETQAGRPVTLTCSSDANPPVLTYTWFKDAACDPTADTSFYKAIQSHSMPTRRSQTLSSVNVSADESKVHCCVARNRHGSQKSTVKLNKSSGLCFNNQVQNTIVLYMLYVLIFNQTLYHVTSYLLSFLQKQLHRIQVAKCCFWE